MGSTVEWRGQRKESENLKIEQQKLPSLNNGEKIDWKIVNGTSGTRGIIINIPHSCYWRPRRRKIGQDWKGTRRNNGWKPPKLGKRHKPTDSRSWSNPELDIEMKSGKSLYLQRKRYFNDSRFVIRNRECQKEMPKQFSSAERKELYTLKMFFGNEREINTFSDKGKLREIATSKKYAERMDKVSSLIR